MPVRPAEHTGARVARNRVLRHLTQQGLANRAHVSASLISKVERGTAPATAAFLGAVARALAVSVNELTGQPYIEELRADQIDQLIQPIREALDVYDLGPDPEILPRAHAVLADEARKLGETIRETNLRAAAAALPALIHETTTAAHLTPSDAMWRTLAYLYRSAYDIAGKLGYSDLSTTALDRLDWAAVRASDPVLASLRQYFRGQAYLRAAQYNIGKRIVLAGLSTIKQAEPSLERNVVTGQLHLGAAILAARDNRETDVTGHLGEALRIAKITGPAEKVLWCSFGPANVALHRVAAHSEMSNFGDAVEAAEGIALDTLPASRVGHHYADLARAQMWSGKPDAAYLTLRMARKAAPQQTRYSPLVRQTVEDLASHYRRVPDNFANFAHWIGM
ncbi:helix-turn-helix domain-containing protein [Streptomyces sp. NPDC051569]|uniref:helix-turn-helix domain-containing protein n=1 Tax=Streptomyces sp. NPDC051569 TaxID=3365661 RepID=UPI0037AF980D